MVNDSTPVHLYQIDSAVKNSTNNWFYLIVTDDSKQARYDMINNSSLLQDEKYQSIKFLNELWDKYPVEFVDYGNYTLVTFNLTNKNVKLTSDENSKLDTIITMQSSVSDQILNAQNNNNSVIQPMWGGAIYNPIVEHAMKELGYSDNDALLAYNTAWVPDTWPPIIPAPIIPGLDLNNSTIWSTIVHSWTHYYNPELFLGSAPLSCMNCTNLAQQSFYTDHDDYILDIAYASHFITDVGNPFHTGEEALQIIDYINNYPKDIHDNYEAYTAGFYHDNSNPNDTNFSANDASQAILSVTKDQSYDGDPYNLTIATATYSHQSLDTIIVIMAIYPYSWQSNEDLKSITRNVLKVSTRTTMGMIRSVGYLNEKTYYIPGSTDGVLSDYQVQFVVHSGTGTDTDRDIYLNGGSLSWPYDFRFTNADNQKLSYWIESYNSTTAVVWVKVDRVAASPATTPIYIHYGKSGDTGESNGPATFVFFDDFSGSALNSSKWSSQGGVSVSGGVATITSSGPYACITSLPSFSTNYAIRANVKSAHSGTANSEEHLDWGGPDWIYTINILFSHPNPYMAGTLRTASGSESYNTLNGWSANTYHTVDYVRNGASSVNVIVDGTYVTTSSFCIYTGNANPHIAAYGSGSQMTADWILVRKYTPNEPVPLPGLMMGLALPEEQGIIGPLGQQNNGTTWNNTTVSPGESSIINGLATSK